VSDLAPQHHDVALEGALGGNQTRDEVGRLAIADLQAIQPVAEGLEQRGAIATLMRRG
jgi:hypothetical protein